MEVVKTDCALCVNCCGIKAYVSEGKIVKIEGDPENPLNRGHLCPKGERLIEWEYSPHRLKYPLKREDGMWRRINWDEALDIIAETLIRIKEEHGAHALAVYNGSVGVEHVECSFFAQRFRGAYGTPNYFTVDTGCWRSRIFARQLTFGAFFQEDVENSKCIILWAHNPDASNPVKARLIREALSKGARLIVIDPRRVPLAKEGIYLQIRPGTDVALALGFMNVIIQEELYDKEFVEKWTYGFDKLVKHVKEYTPERVEEITWVPASDIKNCARIYATTKPASIVQGTCALDRQANNVQNSRALAILQAITGNVGNPGGWIWVRPLRTTDLRIPVDERPIGVDDYPAFFEPFGKLFPYGHAMLLTDAILSEKPYPIKGLIIAGGNPALALPDSKRFERAARKLDLMVVIDVVMSETAELAHIVLPACTFLEQTGLGSYPAATMHGIPWITLRKKVVEPPGECWPDWKIWSELGRRMGFGDLFPWKDDEEMVAMLIAPSEITLDQLKANPSGLAYTAKEYGIHKEGFRTPSGKIEIYSKKLEQAKFDPLPKYVEPSQSPIRTPKLAKDYPLILITGARPAEYIHYQLRTLPELRKLNPEPLMEINPVTAARYGVLDGELVYVETPLGRIKIKAKLTPEIAPQVVSIPHGWAQANENILTDLTLRDPIAGYPEDKGLLCRIRKIGGE